MATCCQVSKMHFRTHSYLHSFVNGAKKHSARTVNLWVKDPSSDRFIVSVRVVFARRFKLLFSISGCLQALTDVVLVSVFELCKR